MKQTKAVRHISRLMAAVMAFSACQQGLALTAFADDNLTLTPKFHENATVEVSGSKITVTDTSYNDDVWNSKALVDTGMTLVPGKQYTIDFNLSGKESVGEFFLCKTESMDARYDDTFTTDPGSRVNTFTAIGEKLFVGMQVGNAGMDNSVTCDIASISELELGDTPTVLKSACADVALDGKTITVTDTSDNNDVWNSKVLFDAGVELIPGKQYDMSLELTGADGVGEFFVCKSLDLNDRVDATFRNTPGTKNMTFFAPGERLYIGMQFGNIGKGNTVSCNVTHVAAHKNQPPKTLVETKEEDGHIIIKATDNSSCKYVWDSKVLYKVADDLVVGQEYEITLNVSGTNGLGEVFLNQNESLDWDKHYVRSDAQAPNGDPYYIFVDSNAFKVDRDNPDSPVRDGAITMRFVAVDGSAYLGMQVGNVGKGNSVTVDVSKPVPVEEVGKTSGIKSAEGGITSVTKKLAASHTNYDPADHVTANKDTTVLTMTDTADNNDVSNSKLTYFFGSILEAGKKYIAKINLAVTKNGKEFTEDVPVGEFYFLKSDNIDDRYTFDDRVGDHTVTFTADSDKLYAGAQYGNLGVGNTMTVTIDDLFEAPGTENWHEGCDLDENRGSVTITDTDGGTDPWNSKAVYDTGITLVEGQEYTATFNMETSEGAEGMGEFYFLKDNNIDDRYTFDNTGGEHTVNFTADSDGTLYMGMMGGNLGEGNSMTVSDIVVTPNEPAPTSLEGGPAPEVNE